MSDDLPEPVPVCAFSRNGFRYVAIRSDRSLVLRDESGETVAVRSEHE